MAVPSPDQILQQALDAHGCTTGTLHVLDPVDGHLKLAAQTGLPAEVTAIVAVVPVGKGMAGLAAERREPVQTCNLQTDTTGDIRPGAKAVPVQASVAVPMIVDGQLRGVLGFARSDYHQWTVEELAGLAATAAACAEQLSAR